MSAGMIDGAAIQAMERLGEESIDAMELQVDGGASRTSGVKNSQSNQRKQQANKKTNNNNRRSRSQMVGVGPGICFDKGGKGGKEYKEFCVEVYVFEVLEIRNVGQSCSLQNCAHILCGYPALKGTEDIQCYNNVGIGRPVQSGERERLELNGHTFPPKKWCNLTPEARKHIKQCIHFHPGNRPCLATLWFNEWRTTTEEAIIEFYSIMYIEETNDGKEQNEETEKNKIKDNWNSFMNKAKKQSKRKKRKLKQFANKDKRKEEDGNKRNIVHWLQLYEKRWNSPEDLEEYNNYPVPCGAWGCVK
eukprot:jgi/Psemu1/13924/gm1.13924_g